MNDKKPSGNTASAPSDDKRNHPVYKAGQAVAAFMTVVWIGVVILVLYLVFRFWSA